MPGIGLVLDPVGEDASNVPLSLNDGVKFRAMKASYPTPPRNVQWASNSDTEGAERGNLQYGNRTITIECRVVGTSAADLQTQLGYLEQKVGKINDTERGTHEYVSPSGAVCVFDLLEGVADYDLDNSALANWRTTATITFTAKPFWRAGLAHEVAGVDHVETTKPVVIGVDTAVGGEVPAVGRLVIDEDQGQDQWTLIWGLQCESYDSSADAELFYEAEALTPQGGAAVQTLAGASGGKAVLQGGLINSYVSMLSTHKLAANHLRNVGVFRVFGRFFRPATNAGQVSIALEWGQGDFRLSTRNDEKTWAVDELEGAFTFVDLGLVHLDAVVAGTQRWEGRVLAKSTVNGDDIYCDYLSLFPVDDGYGVLKVVPLEVAPTAITGHDEFEQTAGNLEGKTLPSGQTWAETNKTGENGFKVNASHYAERAKVSDSLFSGCFAQVGSASYGAFSSSVTVLSGTAMPAGSSLIGLLGRYVSTEKWVMAVLENISSNTLALQIIKKTESGVVWIDRDFFLPSGFLSASALTSDVTISMTIAADGKWEYSFGGYITRSGRDSDMAVGGVLASGKVGIYDEYTSGSAGTRKLDNFRFFEGPPADAASFANQSAEIRDDRMQREDSAGTLWVPRTDYKGGYFRMPPSRREGRQVRTVCKLSRGNIDYMSDPAIDDASFRIFWQKRGLVLPT